jgi:hypothetical protein
MKNRWFLAGIMFLLVPCLISGCGVAQEKYDAMVAERDSAQAQAGSLQGDLTQAKNQMESLKSELTTSQSDLETAQNDLEKSQSDLEAEQNKLETVESELVAAEKRISSVQSESSRVKSELEAARVRIIELEEAAKPLYEDDFSDPFGGWFRGSEEEYEMNYEDGEYHIKVNKYNWMYHDLNKRAGKFADFALEVDARVVSGRNDTGYALIFRAQDTDNTGYCFQVYGNGYYNIHKRVSGVRTTLHDKTESAFIKEGSSTNHLKVVCKGSQIVAYVNGYHLATVTDDTFTEGYVGLGGGTIQPGGHVAFDNIRVYSLD